MLDALLSGLVTGYAIAMPVGAVAVMIIAVSSRTSWRTGAAAGLGVATVDGGYAAVAVLAGTAVARALEPVSGVLTGLSVVVLLGIAVLTLVHAFRPERADGGASRQWTPLRAWLTFAAAAAVLFVSDLGLGPLANTCHAAAAAPPSQHEVVMYATAECPYCAKARAYFQAHGVAFREIDIDASAQAHQEWLDKGGRGTPLIYVDGQRIEGFVAAKLDAALAPPAPSAP